MELFITYYGACYVGGRRFLELAGTGTRQVCTVIETVLEFDIHWVGKARGTLRSLTGRH